MSNEVRLLVIGADISRNCAGHSKVADGAKVTYILHWLLVGLGRRNHKDQIATDARFQNY